MMLSFQFRCAVLTALAASLLLSACRGPHPHGYSETKTFGSAERASVRAASEHWENATSARDFETVASLYAKDAVLLPPGGGPIRGRAAIGEHFAEFPPFSNLELELQKVDGRGDLAYAWGTFSMDLELPGQGTVHEEGKYLEVWQRQPDGAWLILRDMYNSDAP